MQGLSPENVSTFYENLEIMLQLEYEPQYIWNYDEFRAQIGRNGGGRVLAKKGCGACTQLFQRSVSAFPY